MRVPRWLLLLFAIAASASAAAPPAGRIQMGDDPSWAAADFDDRTWAPIGPQGIPMRTGPFWVRVRVRAPEGDALSWQNRFVTWPRKPRGAAVDSIFLSPAFSFELYWDGRLLERNGVVGDSPATETPGTLNRLVRIPPELLGPGEHVIALRISGHHYNFPSTHSTFDLVMENYERRLIYEARRPVLPLIGVGAALLVGAVCAVFYFLLERRRPLLLGGLLGLAMALFYGLIALRWIHQSTYDWHCPRLTAITLTMGVIAVLLPWMLLEQFGPPRRGWWLAALAPLLVAAWYSSPVYEVKALWICRAMLVVALGAMLWAVWRKKPGAWFVLVGIVAGLLVVRTSRRVFLDPSFFLLFDVLVLFPLAALGLQLRAERRRAQEATLAAIRLETELLKKNIQPHFLINTLSTIMEVIERDAASAITLIESLAAEFRILARVSGEKLIPLAQELELCRAHLAIMSRRKDARCVLEISGALDEQALVPPAVLHTLIENGLTHLRPRDGEQRFVLEQTRDAGCVRYTLTAYGTRVRQRVEHVPAEREGTGLRYVKARLEESFAKRWSIESGPTDDGWRTVITLGDVAAPPANANRCNEPRALAPRPA